MKRKITDRGFAVIEFRDIYDVACNIQKSSLATKDAIWVGVSKTALDPRILASKTEAGGNGWVPYYIPDDTYASI